MGYQLLQKPLIQAAMKDRKAAQTERTQITADVVLGELLRVARSDLAAAFNADGSLKPIHEIPEETRRAISGIETNELWAGSGDYRVSMGQTRKLRLWDKTKALELLGKHLKLYTEIHSIPELEGLASRLDAARKRTASR
jgi:phage terminase small subunit